MSYGELKMRPKNDSFTNHIYIYIYIYIYKQDLAFNYQKS